MVVGEQQILGQIRNAYLSADADKAAGRTLHELAQQALRVGKRVHTETGIDRAGARWCRWRCTAPRRSSPPATRMPPGFGRPW